MCIQSLWKRHVITFNGQKNYSLKKIISILNFLLWALTKAEFFAINFKTSPLIFFWSTEWRLSVIPAKATKLSTAIKNENHLFFSRAKQTDLAKQWRKELRQTARTIAGYRTKITIKNAYLSNVFMPEVA